MYFKADNELPASVDPRDLDGIGSIFPMSRGQVDPARGPRGSPAPAGRQAPTRARPPVVSRDSAYAHARPRSNRARAVNHAQV